jgi:hypothetical protein
MKEQKETMEILTHYLIHNTNAALNTEGNQPPLAMCMTTRQLLTILRSCIFMRE